MNADILHRDWALFKKVLNKSLAGKNLAESYRLLGLICQYGYTYNFLHDYKDDHLEDCLYRLTAQIKSNTNTGPVVFSNTRRVIFYDFFTLDFRGFTQQYIDYFIAHDIEFLYIMYAHNYSEKKQIVQAINDYPGGRILTIDTKKDTAFNNLQAVYEELSRYNAGKIFVHNSPWDIFSCCLGIMLRKTGIKSYLIDITDHAFWPGNTVFDYIINFRDYGAQLNHFYRQVPLNKLLIINTPAFMDTSIAFKGFPADVTGKVVGFGGGSVYKIKDGANTYLNQVKSLLRKNDNFIFFFANVADRGYVNNFVRENNLEGRLIPVGNREDICTIFQHIDIYFNTYPYGGGNMVSYGFQHKVPVVAMYNKKYPYTRLDLVFDIEVEQEFILETEEQFYRYANSLIRSASRRKEVAESFFHKMNSKQSFEAGVQALLNEEIKELAAGRLNRIDVDNESIVAFHLQDSQFQKNEYAGLKAAIMQNNFIDAFKAGWASSIYWKLSFIPGVKGILKKYFPFLKKFKTQ